MCNEEKLQEWFRIIMICVWAVLTIIAFVVGYNMGQSNVEIPDRALVSATTTLQSAVIEPYYEALGDPGKAIQHFDYKNHTRTTCYTINKTCYVDKLDVK